MARIELHINKHIDTTIAHRSVLVAETETTVGTHQTELGELTISETVSPDGAQRALLLQGEAMRGHGKHVRRSERMVQMSGTTGEINLGPSKVLRVTEEAPRTNQVTLWAAKPGQKPWPTG